MAKLDGEPLLSAYEPPSCDSYVPSLHEHRVLHHVRRWLPWIIHAIIMCFYASLLTASFIFWPKQPASRPHNHDDVGYQRPYSPIWEAVQYEKRTFYAGEGGPSVFMGHPRPELDEAWANITDGKLILLNETGMEAIGQTLQDATNIDGLYFALPEYYHQMHCLDIIRKYMFRESYPEFEVFKGTEEEVWGHVDHCIDLIRQVIMCAGDVGLIIYYWEGPKRLPTARFATEHMCRNLDMIDSWVRDHAWEEGKTPTTLVMAR